MEREQLENLLAKYRRQSQQISRYSEKKCDYFEDVANDIEANFNIYLDDFYETEEDILEGAQMGIDERDDFYGGEDLIDNIF